MATRGATHAVVPTLILVLFFGFLLMYAFVSFWLLQQIQNNNNDSSRLQSSSFSSSSSMETQMAPNNERDAIHDTNKIDIIQLKPAEKQLFGIPITNNYHSWLNVALFLASQSPSELLSILDQVDPFQVRAFDASLIQSELEHERSLSPAELAQLFPCPPIGQRITLPNQVNQTKAKLFRDNSRMSSDTLNDNNNGYFLFFQHLRKAGGTHFCSLAQANLLPKHVPDYYCMPDWEWSHYKTAGYLHSYTNQQLIQYQQQQGWRIAGNEWQPFRTIPQQQDSHLHLPAVFATSFRKPLHRALSQFRFECIENRGCTIKNVTHWWEVEGALKNVYLSTFADITQLYGFYRACHDMTEVAIQQRRTWIEHAMNVLSQFHLVLIMEWLAYASPLLQSVLGFHHTEGVTQRVRPHIVQAQRQGGKEFNHLGAAGIQSDGASWEPQEYLDSHTFRTMSEDLALDALLTDIARRIFLERTVCMDT